MSPFLASVLITLTLWMLVGIVAWLLVRLIGKYWRYRGVRRWTYRIVAILASIAFLLFVSSDDPKVQQISGWVAFTVIALPTIVFLFLQGAFWAYHWLIHGDPFYEAPLLGERGYRESFSGEQTKRRKKKMCPICKRMTFCRVNRSIRLGTWIHVING